ncbi:hypothetical protein COY29_06255 [Candidatus Woesebacteria bacterium CG_4_10_14_0_2_um_filter_39_14]|uniref:Uncharacterized protein n=3 Tax=Candidatus Woeseibacteriota TaxID=1752722 RepID=A0A2M7XAG4_9BACT|nr:MAG: hypothetical protein COS80_01095 [Candidatus Woesebacteria bacterium CG06_land_8_20_14_3_00_39_27]PIZ46695.1 MAG: hypothetical protein COY29_06255 [Candidatus Woesebacteria bacterium CG_4_10_14_0_2_um_filter_39_14]PJA43138.1 MAG: hypothetical protein CO176_00055 [Candidatus Woesebacteria bacterium CG_4_9_14_3_um_filter_39_10]
MVLKMIHHKPTLSWSPESRVKRQINIGSTIKTAGSKDAERADLLAKDDSGSSTKRDIIKSLITVSFILCLELVIYLVRSK